MADNRNVPTRLWSEEWFLDLSPDAKVLYLYARTNPRANLAGIYALPRRVILVETGLNEARLAKAILELGWTHLRYADGIVWVVGVRDEELSNTSDKLLRCVNRDVSLLPDIRIVSDYKIRYGYPIDTLFSTLDTTERRGRDTEREEEKESEEGEDTEGRGDAQGLLFVETPAPSSKPAVPYEDDFAHWYASYPRHEGRKQALVAYQRCRRAGMTRQGLTDAAAHYATATAGKEAGFMKLPATFLNMDAEELGEWIAGIPAAYRSAQPTPPPPGQTLKMVM